MITYVRMFFQQSHFMYPVDCLQFYGFYLIQRRMEGDCAIFVQIKSKRLN